jgi:hypothetical protein
LPETRELIFMLSDSIVLAHDAKVIYFRKHQKPLLPGKVQKNRDMSDYKKNIPVQITGNWENWEIHISKLLDSYPELTKGDIIFELPQKNITGADENISNEYPTIKDIK